jgi:hypothetical protein
MPGAEGKTSNPPVREEHRREPTDSVTLTTADSTSRVGDGRHMLGQPSAEKAVSDDRPNVRLYYPVATLPTAPSISVGGRRRFASGTRMALTSGSLDKCVSQCVGACVNCAWNARTSERRI